VIAKRHRVVTVSDRLKSAIEELRRLDKLLRNDNLDPRILTDFRDALNRVRNTAWSAQQYLTLKNTEQDSASVLSLLTGERIRVTYQLCQLLQTDLNSSDVRFQPAQLLQLYSATKDLTQQLKRAVRALD
jgi:hypothetical protein